MMVTFKLLGDKIFCEDKKSVSVVDAQSMQQIASINMPDENTYLTAVYKDQLSNTILMAFDNRKMIGYDA
jgi:ribosome recycling factor